MMSPMRISIVIVFALCVCGSTRAVERPNILLLFADDQRADTIAAHGNPHIKTPHLDRLVKSGFSFRQNYCFGSNSGAVCVPSRAMLMTGKIWMHTNMQMHDEKILPELLGENGYTTFATGKWHNQAPALLRGFQQGKAIYLGGMSDHTEVFLQDILPSGQLGNRRIGEGFSSQLFADAVIEFLSTYGQDKPFFAYVAFTAPHDPRQPPPAYRQMYYDERPPLPRNFQAQHPFDNGHVTGRDENLAAWPRTDKIVSDQLAEYYGLITHMDEQVGRVLKALHESGHSDETIVIYAADHGLAVGSHGLLGKQSVYEHSMKCPLVFVGPDIPEQRSTDAFTYLLDIYPTICSLSGIEPLDGLEGKDLSALWSGQTASVRDSIFLPFRDVQRAVRDRQWKLICYPQINHMQLFDLQNDPDELHNLADDPRHAQEKEKMLALMQRWQQQVGDTQTLQVTNPQARQIDLAGRKRVPDRWQPKWIRDKYFGGAQASSKDQAIIEELRIEFGGN